MGINISRTIQLVRSRSRRDFLHPKFYRGYPFDPRGLFII